MISDIQEKEFWIPITKETNSGVLKAEEEFYYNNSYNFWYAVNDEGKILGSIGRRLGRKTAILTMSKLLDKKLGG
jgi:hypothetical protein